MIGPTDSRRAFVASAACAALAGCLRPSTLPLPAIAPSSGTTGLDSLKFHAAQRGLLYGCAVNTGRLLVDKEYTALVLDQANIVVAENSMKWAALRPTISTYNFDGADRFVGFAEQHRIKVRGHNLVWHRQLPTWFQAEANEMNARSLLTGHIERVAGRYAGRLHSWDVVNEAVNIADGRPDGLRNSPWLKLLGPEYIEIAFRTARSADPQALLTYNDFGVEGESPADQRKRTAIIEMLRRMKTRDVPVDALGIQAHIKAAGEYGAGLRRFIAEARQLGLQVFLTEMDVNDRKMPSDDSVRDAAVATAYEQFLGAVLPDPALRAVLTWGITDRYTWLNGEDARQDRLPERCLPFDRECKPKSAFFAIRKAFDQRTVVSPTDNASSL